MKIIFDKNDIFGILIWGIWLTVALITFSLVPGSYAENEPISAVRYGYLSLAWLPTGGIVWWIRKRMRNKGVESQKTEDTEK